VVDYDDNKPQADDYGPPLEPVGTGGALNPASPDAPLAVNEPGGSPAAPGASAPGSTTSPPATTPPVVGTPATPGMPATPPATTAGMPPAVLTILQSRCAGCHTYGQGDVAGWG